MQGVKRLLPALVLLSAFTTASAGTDPDFDARLEAAIMGTDEPTPAAQTTAPKTETQAMAEPEASEEKSSTPVWPWVALGGVALLGIGVAFSRTNRKNGSRSGGGMGDFWDALGEGLSGLGDGGDSGGFGGGCDITSEIVVQKIAGHRMPMP